MNSQNKGFLDLNSEICVGADFLLIGISCMRTNPLCLNSLNTGVIESTRFDMNARLNCLLCGDMKAVQQKCVINAMQAFYEVEATEHLFSTTSFLLHLKAKH